MRIATEAELQLCARSNVSKALTIRELLIRNADSSVQSLAHYSISLKGEFSAFLNGSIYKMRVVSLSPPPGAPKVLGQDN